MEYYYHGHTRSIIGVFGAIFNDIKIARREANGSLTNQRTVPIAYGPRQKFLTRIDEKPTLPSASVAIKLPRMSYEAKTPVYDPSRQGQKARSTTIGAGEAKAKVWAPVPYKMSFELNIMTKNQDEGLQVLEQILPMFAPSFGFQIKPIKGRSDIVDDVKITLTGSNVEDQYAGDFTTRRVLIYTLTFDVIFNLYRPIQTGGAIIKHVTIKYHDYETEALISTTDISLDPPDADESDNYEIVIEDIPGFDDE